MLSETVIKQMAGLLKIDPAKLTEAIKSEKEEAIEISDKLQVLTEDDITRIKNEEYKNGKEAGVEMEVKKVKEELKLDFQGKSIKGLLEASNKKVSEDAKIEPNEKVKTLEADLSTLRTTISTLEKQVVEKDKAFSSASVEKSLYKAIPTLGENAPDVDVVVTLAKAKGYDFAIEEGQLVVTQDGQIKKDNLAKPIPAKDFITSFAKENKLITDVADPAGRGGKDQKNNPATFTKLSELKTHYEGQGKHTAGQEFMDHAAKLKAENKDFDFNA